MIDMGKWDNLYGDDTTEFYNNEKKRAIIIEKTIIDKICGVDDPQIDKILRKNYHQIFVFDGQIVHNIDPEGRRIMIPSENIEWNYVPCNKDEYYLDLIATEMNLRRSRGGFYEENGQLYYLEPGRELNYSKRCKVMSKRKLVNKMWEFLIPYNPENVYSRESLLEIMNVNKYVYCKRNFDLEDWPTDRLVFFYELNKFDTDKIVEIIIDNLPLPDLPHFPPSS